MTNEGIKNSSARWYVNFPEFILLGEMILTMIKKKRKRRMCPVTFASDSHLNLSFFRNKIFRSYKGVFPNKNTNSRPFPVHLWGKGG